MNLNRKIRYGMVGGGPGAFIGEVHRKAAALDGNIELVAGAFSDIPQESHELGAELHLDPNRVYDTYEEMVRKEAALPAEERIDFVTVVTPNFLHHPVSKVFLEAGFNVVCEKPMTNTLEEAEELCRLVESKDAIFVLTHTYTGYPMVKQAKAMVEDGKLGTIRKIIVEYPQGWLAEAGEGGWRTEPGKAGVSSAVGDIGSHAENLVGYITGLKMTKLYADINSFVEGRELEDDANMLVHYEGGARGILYASQISVGEENALNIRIYGTKASMEWSQENPNYLHLRYQDKPEEIYKRGNEYLSDQATDVSRIPSGHPEGFIEAFANIYLNMARMIDAKVSGTDPVRFATDFQTVQDGARGIHFIHKAIESGKSGQWVDMDYTPPGEE